MNCIVHAIFRVLSFLGLYENVISGYLEVTGNGSVTIDLKCHKRARALFDDDCYILTPCGGGLSDSFNWKVNKTKCCNYELEIKWSVQRPRIIHWSANC